MGAVTGLILDSRIPPGVHVDDVVGGGQVEAEAACFERDEKDIAVAGLKGVDSGFPIKLIAPLHYKGDMFVVKPDFPAKTWKEFIEIAKNTKDPIRIGYKSPVAVAKVIFEEALQHEGIVFGGDLSVSGLQVHLINVKGGGKLNVALSGNIIDGYIGNNPFPAIGLEKKILRVICDLEELPPGTFRNHPCCCIAATTKAIQEKPEAIVDMLVLFLQATDTINTDLDKAVASATKWIGTSAAAERMSIPTSGYSMENSPQWQANMNQWTAAMKGLKIFKNQLKDVPVEKTAEIAYDFSLLEQARNKLAQQQAKK